MIGDGRTIAWEDRGLDRSWLPADLEDHRELRRRIGSEAGDKWKILLSEKLDRGLQSDDW